jgi:hypothetical protein
MSVFASRNFVSWVMVILFPVSRLAVHRGSAMVHRNGGERGRAVALSALYRNKLRAGSARALP